MKNDSNKRYKHIQALICPAMHKDLKRRALDKNINLSELLREIFTFYFERKEDDNTYIKENKGGED